MDQLGFKSESNSEVGSAEPTALSRGPQASTAIDLYSGVGGWSLGLKLAGFKILSAYERAERAAVTYSLNLGDNVVRCDIRRLRRADLPKRVDVVVGSPPCTQFSFANRGGGGDIRDGLRDVARMLWIVQCLKPRFWLMENVPRLMDLLDQHLHGRNALLGRFRHLFDRKTSVDVVDMSNFGLPQRRLRCIAGRYPKELLYSYRAICGARTLGDTLAALNTAPVIDPTYGFAVKKEDLIDHDPEEPLSPEELRLNRDAKTAHPVYNRMDFPDRTDRAVRSITATCTRVSRESIIVEDPHRATFRRLTLRERASLQGFPITYQFFGLSQSSKMEMIGNALPPSFAYYVGCALRGQPLAELKHPHELSLAPIGARERPLATPTTINVKKYPPQRRFTAALPTLRWGSGARFELSNEFARRKVSWRIEFYFGRSTDIRTIRLDGRTKKRLNRLLRQWALGERVATELQGFAKSRLNVTARSLQAKWTHLTANGPGPHEMLDELSDVALRVARVVGQRDRSNLRRELLRIPALRNPSSKTKSTLIHDKKFSSHCEHIFAGLILGSWFNTSSKVKCSTPGNYLESRAKHARSNDQAKAKRPDGSNSAREYQAGTSDTAIAL